MIAEARKRWNRCSEAEEAQRKRILLAKQFRAGDQWDAALKISRAGGQAIQGQPAQPPRPCLVVDRLSQPCRQVSNTIKNAEFGFDVLPNGGGADTETAEIFKGAMRRVHNEARGEAPVEWAADGAIEGGIGWFRLYTDYAHQDWSGDPNDPEVFDQEIRMGRIANNLTVYCDPSSNHPTRRTAQYMFVTEDLDKDEFKRLYPDADIRGLEEFMATGDMVGWMTEDSIRIAEYWRVTYESRTFYQLVDGTVVEWEKGPKPAKDQIKQQRVMKVPQVKCDKINAIESLESYEWLGTRIPLFPVLGEELNVDGKPILRGIISEGMDAQRMVNYTYSGAMEIFALEPKSPWIAEADTIEPYQHIWQTANLYNYSYLPWARMTADSTQPFRTDRRGDGLQAAVELMRVSEDAIKATTSTGDASLGNTNPNERSGRALQSLQAQSDLANSNYPDNTRRALIDAACEMAIVLPKITRPGQILQILGVDDDPKQVMIGQPFKEGQNGVPEQAPPEITPEIAKLKASIFKFYDLNNGSYSVTVTVGKATATKREEGAAALGELIPHLPPEMAAVATPDYVEQLSFPGASKIAERLRSALPPQLQEKKDQGDIPPQAQMMIQQLQMQLQQATQALQTDQAKQQATIQSTQIKAQADTQSAEMGAQRDLELQKLKDASELQMAQMKAQIEMETKLRIQQMEADLAIQLQQMKDESAERIAEKQATIKAQTTRRVSMSKSEDGYSVETSGGLQ
jgi:Phage P22-like portal protein